MSAAADGNHDAHRGAAPKAAGGIVNGEREYLVECESLLKFIGSDACYLTLLFLLSQYSLPSLYLAFFTVSARVRRSPEVRSRFYRRKLVFSRYAVTNNETLQHLLDAHPLAGTKNSMITTRHRRYRLFPLPISASYSNYIS